MTVEPHLQALGTSQVTPKPWGAEVRFSPADAPYVGKLLFVTKGERLSLQRHDEKDESIALVQGHATLILEDEAGSLVEIKMEANVGYRVLPGRAHRLIAHEDSVLVEASTAETGTTYRLADDYGRSDEPLSPPASG
jgi:mannose-6-phosphate isomerase